MFHQPFLLFLGYIGSLFSCAEIVLQRMEDPLFRQRR